MKIRLSSPRLFALGFVLLVASNITVLSGVKSNRSGEPESLILLTERELQLPYNIRNENSGIALRLNWRMLSMDENGISSTWTSPAWFNTKKSEELGFKIDSNGEEKKSYKKPIPKEVFIVLEKDGVPYKEAVKRAEAAFEREERLFKFNPEDKELSDRFENAKKRLERERNTESRLFAIDAALDPHALREKYGDRKRYIIVKGSVEPGYGWDAEKKEFFGYISGISVESIYVPLQHRQIFDAILAEFKSKGYHFEFPRFEVELAYGNRWEPWIASVKPIKGN